MTLKSFAHTGTNIVSNIFNNLGTYGVGGIGSGLKYSVFRGVDNQTKRKNGIETTNHTNAFERPIDVLKYYFNAQLFNVAAGGVSHTIKKNGDKYFGAKKEKSNKIVSFMSKNAILSTLMGGVSAVYAMHKFK